MLNNLSVDQCNQLKEVLKESEFNELKYDEIKTAVDVIQLQKVHQDSELSTHILTVCTGNDDAKRNLMDALCFLQKQESTLSILNNLSLSEYNQLNKALYSFAFSGPKYAELKKVVGSFQKDKVYSICIAGGKLDKQQLLTTLNKNDNQFIIFNVLADRERKALLKVLTNDFLLGYDNLRSAVTLPSQPAVLFSSRLDSGRVNKKREREEKQNNAKPTPEEKRSFKKPRGGGNTG